MEYEDDGLQTEIIDPGGPFNRNSKIAEKYSSKSRCKSIDVCENYNSQDSGYETRSFEDSNAECCSPLFLENLNCVSLSENTSEKPDTHIEDTVDAKEVRFSEVEQSFGYHDNDIPFIDDIELCTSSPISERESRKIESGSIDGDLYLHAEIDLNKLTPVKKQISFRFDDDNDTTDSKEAELVEEENDKPCSSYQSQVEDDSDSSVNDENSPSKDCEAIVRTEEASTSGLVIVRERSIFVQHSYSTAALRMNLSFCGCGFLGIYHLGVAQVLTSHGPRLLLNTQRYCGASAGSLVAAVLAIKGADIQTLEESTAFTYNLASMVQKKALGLLTPRLSVLDSLQSFLMKTIPDDGHVKANGRLYVSLTKFGKRKNILVSEFSSKEHLIQCLLASSYVPLATGTKPVKIDGSLFMDGGMTDNLPVPPEGGRTVFISPFSGRQDICPQDNDRREWYTSINNQAFQVCPENIVRGLHAFFPPKMDVLEAYYKRGLTDAERFLRKEGMWEDAPGESGYREQYEVLKEKTDDDVKPTKSTDD